MTPTSRPWRRTRYYFPAVGLLSNVGTAIVFGYGGWLYIQGDVGLGTLVAFTGYLSNFFDPVQQLSQLYNTFLAASAALDKIFDVMDVEPRAGRRSRRDRHRHRRRRSTSTTSTSATGPTARCCTA